MDKLGLSVLSKADLTGFSRGLGGFSGAVLVGFSEFGWLSSAETKLSINIAKQ